MELNSTRAAVQCVIDWFRKPNVWDNLFHRNPIQDIQTLTQSEDRDDSLLMTTKLGNDVAQVLEAQGLISHLMVPIRSSSDIRYFIRVDSSLFRANMMGTLCNYPDLDEVNYVAWDAKSGKEIWACPKNAVVKIGYKELGGLAVFLFARHQFTRAFYERDDEGIQNSLLYSFMSLRWTFNSPTKLLRYPFDPVLGKFDFHGMIQSYHNQILQHQLPRQGTIIHELGYSMNLVVSLRRSAYRRAYSALSIHPQRFFEIDCDFSGVLDTSSQHQLLTFQNEDEEVH